MLWRLVSAVHAPDKTSSDSMPCQAHWTGTGHCHWIPDSQSQIHGMKLAKRYLGGTSFRPLCSALTLQNCIRYTFPEGQYPVVFVWLAQPKNASCGRKRTRIGPVFRRKCQGTRWLYQNFAIEWRNVLKNSDQGPEYQVRCRDFWGALSQIVMWGAQLLSFLAD